MTTRSPGQALVEFALVIPIVLLVLLAIFDFGRGIFAYNALSNAAREGARVLIVDQNEAVVEAKARDATTSMDQSIVDVTIVPPSDVCAPVKLGCPGRVTVEYTYRAITPVIGSLIGPIDLSSSTEMPVERIYSSPILP